MKKHWRQSLFRIVLWISAEIVLNLLNLDTLSDYSEFLFEKPSHLLSGPRIVLSQPLQLS
ncbi:MAG: hypothetical protein QNJ46_12260 [Leptolyngbyaceae cyanobacterium MO_188.B28]|nr:hypothetical protein [Leptolyngbyaceae cyanobacterium MO_188.B28]